MAATPTWGLAHSLCAVAFVDWRLVEAELIHQGHIVLRIDKSNVGLQNPAMSRLFTNGMTWAIATSPSAPTHIHPPNRQPQDYYSLNNQRGWLVVHPPYSTN
mmetsp:Transcript_87620/g.145580  ORF Transcript_87620/g.145580 Transcript_87620/m.145580 type:complete len:102 (+) Transcript_87620:367-672(+)